MRQGNLTPCFQPLSTVLYSTVEYRLTDSKGFDSQVSAHLSNLGQLEATIRSAHALLKAGLVKDATSLLAAFSTEVQPTVGRELTEVRSKIDRTLTNAERW
jgi:hypothetical protein